MSGLTRSVLMALAGFSLSAGAEENTAEQAGGVYTVVCRTEAGKQQTCAADTSAGVVLQKDLGEKPCLLGRNWGYDDAGIWVKDGCSGEFLARSPGSGEADSADDLAFPGETPLDYQENETWGFLDPGQGFVIGSGKLGSASLSAYALVRAIDQGGNDEFVDHLGREQAVDRRKDIYSHRVIVFLKGWMGDPRFIYSIAWWTVNTTDQDALFANLGYQFSRKFNLYGGINGNPGTRSLQGSHPYWLGHDRVMADEFFRPYFTQGLWANGELIPGLWYSAMAGNTSSTLGVTASVIDRNLTYGTSVWWMPTTQEFGPRGAYGDWEMHENLATRVGFSFVESPEERYTNIGEDSGNTTLKLADSLNLFNIGSLADGVTVTNADYQIVSLDAGLKYKGFFLQTELYMRTLDNFLADGTIPVEEIIDTGFYVQTSFFLKPKVIELYAVTSQIYGDDDAGFGDSSEYILGMNYYPFNSRNHRLNVQVMDVNKSPVSSTFGYYTGGQDGMTVAVGVSTFF